MSKRGKAKFKAGDLVTPIGKGLSIKILKIVPAEHEGDENICILDATIQVMDGDRHLRDVNWLFEGMLEAAR